MRRRSTPCLRASFKRVPGFYCRVQGVYQERVDDRINFYIYAVRD
ncbi:MAG TPA: hypothetical protein VIG95_09860 [Gemmatimonadales bacterium]